MTGAVPALQAGTETTVQQGLRQTVAMALTMMEVNIFFALPALGCFVIFLDLHLNLRIADLVGGKC